MGLLERYEREAVMLGRRPHKGGQLITDFDAMRDVQFLAGEEIRNWREINANIKRGGDPTALIGGLSGTPSGTNMPNTTLAAVTGVTVNTALYAGVIYTPIPPALVAPTIFELRAAGVVTSTGAGQTVLVNPHIGTGAVGTGLTAMPTAQTLGSTITNAIWRMKADITVRTAGTGTAATARGSFEFMYTVLANGGAPTSIIWRSTADATFDSSILNGFIFGVTPSAAGVSMAVEQIRWTSIDAP